MGRGGMLSRLQSRHSSLEQGSVCVCVCAQIKLEKEMKKKGPVLYVRESIYPSPSVCVPVSSDRRFYEEEGSRVRME